jgi:antitoxin VapB
MPMPSAATKENLIYTVGIDRDVDMTSIARLFKNGRSQAVRLPREFRFEGDRVRVRRVGRGVLIEPLVTDVSQWFAELDRFGPQPFMPEGRLQPRTPRKKIFDEDVPA